MWIWVWSFPDGEIRGGRDSLVHALSICRVARFLDVRRLWLMRLLCPRNETCAGLSYAGPVSLLAAKPPARVVLRDTRECLSRRLGLRDAESLGTLVHALSICRVATFSKDLSCAWHTRGFFLSKNIPENISGFSFRASRPPC